MPSFFKPVLTGQLRKMFKQPRGISIVIRHIFRMELHGKNPVILNAADGLNDAILCPSFHAKEGAGFPHSLMVHAVRAHVPLPGDALQYASRRKAHGVHRFAIGRLLMMIRSGNTALGFNILNQFAAQRYRQRLEDVYKRQPPGRQSGSPA